MKVLVTEPINEKGIDFLKELGFEVELAETPFFGYEGLLPHVWTNLIGNAV